MLINNNMKSSNKNPCIIRLKLINDVCLFSVNDVTIPKL